MMGCSGSAENRVRQLLASRVTGVIRLPTGVIRVSSELRLAPGAHDLEIVGSATLLQASDEFEGRAVIVGEGVSRIALRDISIEGSRRRIGKPKEMAPSENAFRVFYQDNGVLFDRVDGLEITELR